MKTSLVYTNKLNTHFITTKTKFLTLIAVFLASFGWGQVVSYSFASTSGTYTSITSGTVVRSGNALDAGGATVTLPSAFPFNGSSITSLRVNDDGYLALGVTSFSNSTQPIASSTIANGIIAALACDLMDANAVGTTPEIRWEQIGNEIIFQWNDFARYTTSTSNEIFDFQIRLNTSNGQIVIVYSDFSTVNTTTTYTPQVGLRGSTNADFNSRRLTNSVPTTTPNWSNTAAATTTGHTVRFTSTSPAAFPAAGLTFTFTPPSPCSGTPTAGTIASNTSQNICSGTTPAALAVNGTTSGVTGITYQWEQSTDNAAWANATGGSGATTASYTPPSFGGTTIYYRCKVTCSNSSLFDVTNVATIAPPANPTTQASSLTFSSVSYTGFTATWTNGNGNRRVVYVSDAAITDPTNNSGAAALTASTTYSGSGQQIVFDGTGTSVTVTGLALGTSYNVKVIEYTRCGSSTYDNYFNVTSGTNTSSVTTTAVTAVPWNEGFATGVSTFPNWLTTAGSIGSITALNPALSSNYYYVNLDGTPSTAAITTPIIGSIPSNYRFVVKYNLANYSSPFAPPASGSGNFIVAVSTNNGTSYTDVATVANNAVAGWQEYVLNLSAYVGQNIRIRLTGNYTSGDYYLAFDEYSVEMIPTCYTPTTLTSSAITYQTATIAWAAPTLGTSPAGYEYEVRTSGVAGSGATGLVASGTTTAPTASASITGLSSATTYSYYVRSNCGGGDYSVWSGAGTFVSGCDIPNNPGAISVSNASSTGFTLTNAAASPAPTSYILFFTTGTSATAIPTLVNGTSYSNSTAYTFGGESYTCITNSSVSPVSLSGGTSNTQYNYFLYSKSSTNSCSGAPYYSTGVTVNSVTCAAAPTAPVISSISVNSATVSWTASVVGGGFGTINYSLEVYTDAGYTTPISGSPFSMGTAVTQNLTGLTDATTYFYRVVANNGSCNSSYLTGSFSTLCLAISTFPWNEGFEGVSTGTTVVGSSTSLPSCWNSQSTQWASSNATTYNTAKTGTKYIRYAYSSTNAFIWTPGFQLTAGVTYEFSFYAQGDGFATWVNDVFVNTSVTATGATQLTPSYSPSGPGSASIQAYNLVSRTFVPSTSGVYYFAIRGNQSSSSPWFMAFDDFKLDKKTFTWTGATSSAWNTTTNWSPAAVPTSNDNVIIPTSGITIFPVVSGLTIAAGSTMTLNANSRLTVNGNIVNDGTLTLESGATLVQGTGNTASGTGVYNVQQALTGAGGATPNGRFWYMGSPLSGASSTAFDAAGANKLWTYAEATQSYTEITTNGVAMSPIQGHVARLGASSTINFTGGVLNSGDYTNNTLTNTGTGSTRGYTLVSNPYPSFLDWDLIAAGATGITSSLWYRTNSGSSMVYDTYNATGGVSTLNSGVTTNPRYIPPMQAFWVYNQTDGTTGSLTISNNMRSHQSNGGLKDATDFPAFVRLNLENDGAIDQTVLYFDNNAAAGYDNFDSDKMMVSNAAQVYTLVGNKKLAINGMKSVKANKQVPLTVEFPTAKAYAFNATEVAMIGGIVLLEDRLKKVFQDLTMNPVYEFVADAGTTSDRFVVHFQPNGGVAGIESAADNGIAIVSNAAGLVTITLSEELPATGTIHIIDINGKVIATQAINEQTTTMNINAATGVYHVLVDSASKVARKKIVITK